ncbi:MAG TPA: glycosyltransferase [Geminicoccaceae bacterium]|nr:glycosyltransferase [Geminicoccaceae bacterium]
MSGGWRCLFWVQSLLGSGHLRRAMLVAEAFAARGAAVTLVNGGPPGPWPAGPDVRLVQLPPIVAKDARFSDLVDASGASATPALHAERQRMLLGRLETMRPQVIATEMFPFGRRAFRGELLPLLEAARGCRPRPLVVASVRDVLVGKPDPRRYDWMVETCLAHYDRVLVHGDERLLPFADSFPRAIELVGRLAHTGFVHPGVAPDPGRDEPAPGVLVSAGGGAVGERLLRAALAAKPLTRLAAAPWLLVGGHNLPQPDFAALEAVLPEGCTLVRHRADLPTLMGQCGASVSQAGYNTVVEGLIAGARMVLVPFAEGGEDEQRRRALRLQELGVAEVVPESGLTPDALAAAIDRVGLRPRPSPAPWSFDGAARSAEIVAALVQDRFVAR